MALDLDASRMHDITNQWRGIDGKPPRNCKAEIGDTVIIADHSTVRMVKRWTREHTGHRATVIGRDRKCVGWSTYTLHHLQCECGADEWVQSASFEKA